MANWLAQTKVGFGWFFNQPDITFNGPEDSSGRIIYFNSLGSTTDWLNIDKS